MDLMRRAASGRLSEIAGPRHAGLRPHDAHARPAQRARWPITPPCRPKTRAVLEAYARGVNAWIAARGPVQRPGIPGPRHAGRLGAGRQPALGRDHGALWLSAQLAHGAVAPVAGRPHPAAGDRRTLAADTTRRRPPGGRIRAPARAGRVARTCADPARFPEPLTRCPAPPRTSGRWTVATPPPARPCWPAIRISPSASPASGISPASRRPQGVLAGATAPGVPFLVLGHNGHIAWTFTTTGADVQDIFIETRVGADGSTRRRTARAPSPSARSASRSRGQPDQILKVRETRHGPVISDLTGARRPDPGGADGQPAPGNTAAAGLLALNHAQSIDGRPARPRP